MNRKILFTTILLTLLCLALPAFAQEGMKPSEALKKAEITFDEKIAQAREAGRNNPEFQFDYNATHASVYSDMLSAARKENLSPEEQLALAELYFFANHLDEAAAIYKKLSAGSGPLAEKASSQQFRILLADLNTLGYDEFARRIADHQSRFSYADQDDPLSDFAEASRTYGRYLVNQGRHKEAVNLVMREIDRLPESPKTVYSTASLVISFYNSFIYLGRRNQALEALKKLLAINKPIYEKAQAKVPKGDSDEARAAQKSLAEMRSTMQALENKLNHEALIGQDAPDFTITRVYNGPEDLSLNGLKGKVVLVDFFTNGCGPCKLAFPALGRIYADYKDKGFELLSITGLQGYFYDGDIKKAKVEPEEEFKLTEDFIKRHDMTWPVLFTEHGARDKRYGIFGVPTMVIIDRSGKVREIEVGFGGQREEDKLRAIIEKLLSE